MSAIFSCPVCKSTVPFTEYGLARRKNARCSKCGALERHRFEYMFLQNHGILEEKGIQFMHIAPEECFRGIFKELWKDNYITGDLAATDVQSQT